MKISLRIKKICDQIENCKCVIDVGSDHAFLSINLLRNGQAKHVVNVEKNKMPLKNGVENISKENLVAKTTNVLGDGFLKINKDWDFDYCVISGLGDKTIKQIIKQKKPHIKTFIFVPNNNPLSLRKYIFLQTCQKIIHEEVIFDGGIYYFLIKTRKSFFKQLPTYQNCLFGPVNKIKKGDDFIKFLRTRAKFIKDNSIANVNTKIKKELKIIERFLKRNDNSKSIK